MFKQAMFCAACAALWSFPAAAVAWQFDPAASRLEFVASFERAAVPGRFTEFAVELAATPRPPAGADLAVTIQLASANFESGEVTAAVKDAAWFDAARFPTARFEAKAIRHLEGDRYAARGTLDLKGVRRELEVPFRWQEAADGANMDGEFSVTRGWFGIGTGRFEATAEVGAEVVVRFHVCLRRHG
jgi:polyisoprenoid-binding protein YceI